MIMSIKNQRLICSCEVKSSISIISQIKVDKNKLYKYIDLKQMINFKVMKCMNLVFSIKDIKTNLGFYSFFPTIIAYIISLFLYSLLEFKIISFKINEIISSKKIMKLIINKKKQSKRIRKRKNLLEKKILEKNFFRKSYFE